MVTLMVIPLLIASTISLGQPSDDEGFSDIYFAEKREDGLYNVICIDQSLEFGVSYEEITAGKVCQGGQTENPLPNEPSYESFLEYCKNTEKYPLEKPLIKALKKEFQDTTCNDLASILPLEQSLSLSHYEIESLAPLYSFTHFTVLHLDNNNIEDLTPLKKMTSLSTLKISSNNITHLKGLKSLKNLSHLDASSNKILDVAGLEGLSRLISLNLSRNLLTDLSSLSALNSLEKLVLSHNKLTNLRGLEFIDGLIELNVSYNDIVFLEELENHEGLLFLVISDNQIRDLTPIEHATNLLALYIDNTKVTDLKPVANLQQLERFSAQGIPLGDAAQKTPENCPDQGKIPQVLKEFCRFL